MKKKIQVLGTGCPRCKKLAENAEAAAKAAGIEYELEKVTGLKEITEMGALMTPALAVDGKIKSAGRVPGIDAIKSMLE